MGALEKQILDNWLSFLKESTRTREKLIKDFENSISKLDKTVAEQRQATILLLKKTLNLQEGDEIILKGNGEYTIVRGNNKMEENKTEKIEEKIILNGREITKEELQRQKEAAATQKGVKLEEVSPNNFRMHLQD